MWLWIEQAPLAAQIPLVLLVVLVPAYLIHRVFAHCWSAREWSRGVQATTISTVGLSFALMASFTAVDVTVIFEKAKAEVAREAASLDGALQLLRLLPGETSSSAIKQLRQYIIGCAGWEWEEMNNRAEKIGPKQEHLELAYETVVICHPADSGQEEVKKRILSFLDNVRNARTARIQISKGTVHPLKWSILIILAFVLQTMMAVSHADKPKARLLMLILLAFSQAIFLIVILAMNHPFGGDITVDPTPLLLLLK